MCEFGFFTIRPSRSEAGPPDCPAPFHPALGGDLLPAVEAAAAVLVGVLQVLGDDHEAVGAACDPVGVVGVDPGHVSLPHRGRSPGP